MKFSLTTALTTCDRFNKKTSTQKIKEGWLFILYLRSHRKPKIKKRRRQIIIKSSVLQKLQPPHSNYSNRSREALQHLVHSDSEATSSRWLFMETLLVLLVFMLAMTGGSDAAWCVCRQDMSDPALQKSLDYACGAGADCSPISQNGACYNPNTVKAHCSYAVNSYYQKKGPTTQACDFSGTASLTQQDPSASSCTFPTSQSTNTGNNNGTGASTGTGVGTGNAAGAGTGTGVSPTPTGTNPGTVTPTPNTVTPTSSGTGGGGVLGGIGPAGNGFSTDNSNESFIPMADMGYLIVLILSVLVMLRD